MRRLAADSVTQFPPTFPPQPTALHSYIRVFVYPHAFRIPLNIIQPIFLDIFHLGRYNQYPFLPSGRIFTNIATASNHQSFLRPVRNVSSVIATAPPVHPRGERESGIAAVAAAAAAASTRVGSSRVERRWWYPASSRVSTPSSVHACPASATLCVASFSPPVPAVPPDSR